MAADPPVDAARRLGVELRRLRRERGLAQRDLRKPLRLASHSAIVEFELGRRIPSQDILAAYERYFRLAAGELQRLRQVALTERAAREARRGMAAGNGVLKAELLDLRPQAETAVPVATSAECAGLGCYLRRNMVLPGRLAGADLHRRESLALEPPHRDLVVDHRVADAARPGPRGVPAGLGPGSRAVDRGAAVR